MNYPSYFSTYSIEALIKITQMHKAKFDDAWRVCMTSSYKTARYIDAKSRMNREYETLGMIHDYVYSCRPAIEHDTYARAIV